MVNSQRRWFYLSSTALSPIPTVAHHLGPKRVKTACGIQLPKTYARWWRVASEMKRDQCPDCLRALRRKK